MTTLDNEGYPTDEFLEWIKKFDLTKSKVEVLLFEIENSWHFGHWGYKRNGNELELHTGGWSGNESIIEALKSNTLFWPMFWKEHHRGGHYYFDKLDRFNVKDIDVFNTIK